MTVNRTARPPHARPMTNVGSIINTCIVTCMVVLYIIAINHNSLHSILIWWNKIDRIPLQPRSGHHAKLDLYYSITWRSGLTTSSWVTYIELGLKEDCRLRKRPEIRMEREPCQCGTSYPTIRYSITNRPTIECWRQEVDWEHGDHALKWRWEIVYASALYHTAKKTIHPRRTFQNDATSSIVNSSPPTGAWNAAATPIPRG